MKLKFVGCGSAFTNENYWQSNMMIETDNKKLLIDCGTHAQFSLKEAYGVNNANIADIIDAIYISHLHADHIGGLEWIAFCTYFNPNKKKLKLYANINVMEELWESSLKGGLESIEGKVMNLTDYFECHAIEDNKSFKFGKLTITPVQTVHMMSGYKIKHSYAVLIDTLKIGNYIDIPDKRVFITTDTQFCPNQIQEFYNQSHVIFHDCETLYKSGVHAHYDDLKTLDKETKGKMWLYHYQPETEDQVKAIKDGFLGFVTKGQEFIIGE